VQVAVETVGDRALVIAGVHGVGWHQAVQWAEYAKEDGADGVLLLPPTIYRAGRAEVIEHYTRVNEVGLPIMLYNNPFDTKVDLTPDIVAELAKLDNVVAIKEFSGDIRRVLELKEVCDLDVIAGADDLLFESLVAGATGWYAGYPNAFPREAVAIFDLVKAGEIAEALELYRHLVAVFRFDSKVEFVQAIKLSIDIAGQSYGGPTRPPRGRLDPETEAAVRRDTQKALDYIASRS
jgi:4-hydroxy-tetrahydrodipicolinate synthase